MKDYYDELDRWWRRRLFPTSYFNARYIVNLPEIYLEDKKMRFRSEFDHYCVGLGDMRIIIDEKDENSPVDGICLISSEAKRLVDWLNEQNERIKELENELELYRHYVEFVPSSGDVE